MDNITLSVQNLRVIYKTNEGISEAVNGIDLVLKKGKILGLVGETGAGKTTTALSIMGLLPERNSRILSGDIFLDEVNLLKLTKEKLRTIRGDRIAMIYQDPMTSLNPVLTIEKQIKEVLQYHSNASQKEMDERVDEVLGMVGIMHSRKKEYPHQFSGGMKQRVVIAMALAMKPDLIIADEPTTALDVTIQLQVLNLIKNLRAQTQTSMLLITHDLGVVVEMCDEVAFMYAGHIVETGTLEDVFTGEKHHPYTVGLFKSIPDITVKSKRLVPIEGLMPNAKDLPKGCPFHPRCTKQMAQCEKEYPKDYVNGSHRIACHLFNGNGE